MTEHTLFFGLALFAAIGVASTAAAVARGARAVGRWVFSYSARARRRRDVERRMKALGV